MAVYINQHHLYTHARTHTHTLYLPLAIKHASCCIKCLRLLLLGMQNYIIINTTYTRAQDMHQMNHNNVIEPPDFVNTCIA